MSIAGFNSLNTEKDTIKFVSELSAGEQILDATDNIGIYNSFSISRWDFGDGSSPLATDLPRHTLLVDGDKEVTIAVDRYENIDRISLKKMKIKGEIDLSGLNRCNNFYLQGNLKLEKVIFPNNPELPIKFFGFYNCGLSGEIDLTKYIFDGLLYLFLNPNLTKVKLNKTDHMSLPIVRFDGNKMDLDTFKYPNIEVTGDFRINNNNFTELELHPNSRARVWYFQFNQFKALDLSSYGFSSGWNLRFSDNPVLTTVKFPSTDTQCAFIVGKNCNLTGTLDLSMLRGIGSSLQFQNNPSLEEIIFPETLSVSAKRIGIFFFNHLKGLKRFVNLEKLTNFGGSVRLQWNFNLNAITFPTSNNPIYGLYMFNTPIKGTLDLSGLTNMTLRILLYNMSDGNGNTLTSILFPASSGKITEISCYGSSDLTGVIDVSGLDLSGRLIIQDQANLTDLIWPDSMPRVFEYAMFSSNTNLNYTDLFTRMSGASNGIIVHLQYMELSTTDVNHYLVDLAAKGWVDGYLDLLGNDAPDNTTGGFDGIEAKRVLVEDYNWTVKTT